MNAEEVGQAGDQLIELTKERPLPVLQQPGKPSHPPEKEIRRRLARIYEMALAASERAEGEADPDVH